MKQINRFPKQVQYALISYCTSARTFHVSYTYIHRQRAKQTQTQKIEDRRIASPHVFSEMQCYHVSKQDDDTRRKTSATKATFSRRCKNMLAAVYGNGSEYSISRKNIWLFNSLLMTKKNRNFYGGQIRRCDANTRTTNRTNNQFWVHTKKIAFTRRTHAIRQT